MGNYPGLPELEAIATIKEPDQVIPAESLFTLTKDKLIDLAKAIAADMPALVMIHPIKEKPEGFRAYLKKYYDQPGDVPEEGDIVVDTGGILENPGVVSNLTV